MEARIRRILRKSLALGLAFNVGLSAWGNFSFAQNDPAGQRNQNQIQSAEEFVPYSELKLEDRKILLMDDWKFQLGDTEGAQEAAFDDSAWNLVNLPHDYSITQNYAQSGEAESAFLLGGIGWYRKNISFPATGRDKKIFINFDGVYMNAEVYLNGHKLGSHPYGYTAFSFELTPHIVWGGQNVLAVKVNNDVPTSRWYSGSGIYREVFLTAVNPVYVEKDGVYVTTPDIKENQSNPAVEVSAELRSQLTEDAEITVTQMIYEKGGQTVLANASETTVLKAGESKKVALSLTVVLPKLWSVENPNLYEVETVLSKGAEELDKQRTTFGFRWFDFDADTGFSLNGRKMKLQGVCMHHDQGALGAAAYSAAMARQIDTLKAMGANAIRTSHNPASEEFVRLANEKGMLLIEEAFDTWTNYKNGNYHDYASYFNASIEADNGIIGKKQGMTWGEWDTKAMVRRDRNAPAVILWSTGNEVLEGINGNTSDYPQTAKKIAEWMKQEDAARPATIGDNKLKDSNNWTANSMANNLHSLNGIIGYNYASGSQLDTAHRSHPEWKLYASETASAINSRGVYHLRGGNDNNFELTAYDEKTVGWGQLASQDWYNIITRDFIAGNFVWTGFDYMGEPTPWNETAPKVLTFPRPKSSYFGIVDLAGFPKDRYYFYSSQWRKDMTTLHLLPEWSDSIKNNSGNVVVYSSAPTVKLYFTPQGSAERTLVAEQTKKEVTTAAGYTYLIKEGSTDHKDLYYSFTKPYAAGTLEAEAYDKNGNKIEETLGRKMVKTAGAAYQLKLSEDKKTLRADGRDLAYVAIEILDENGTPVPNADNLIRVSVSGAGELAAMDNGKQADMTSFYTGQKQAYSGKALAIVKAGRENGNIQVSVSADGLQPASLTLTASGAQQSGEELAGFKYSRNYYVKTGSTLELPQEVKAVLKNGQEQKKTVTWNKDGLDDKLKTPGIFQLSGQVAGGGEVAINVQVLDEVAALLNYSAFTAKNTMPSLPAVRPAADAKGEVLKAQFPVSWETSALTEADFAEEGKIVTIKGKAQVFDKEMEIEAKVRVVTSDLAYGSSVTKDALTVTWKDTELADKAKLFDGNHNETAVEDEGELNFAYATAANFGRVVVYHQGNRPQAALSWSRGSGSPFAPLSVKKTEEDGKTTYDFQGVSAVEMKLAFTGAGGKVTEVELIPVTENAVIYSTAELKTLKVDDVPVDQALLEKEEIPVAADSGVLTAEGKENASVTILPTQDKQAVLLIESEDHSKRVKKAVKFGQGVKDEVISTSVLGALAFAKFTNDRDPNSRDRIENINNGDSQVNGDATPRWSDWQKQNKLRENYVGILLPRKNGNKATISELVFTPFQDGGCQKPSEMEIQIYIGDEYETPDKSKLPHMGELTGSALTADSSWKTVKTVKGDELKDNEENRIALPQLEETTAVRLLMKQVPGKSLAVVELDVYGRYKPKEIVLISENTKSSVLPQAFASFTCSGDEVTHLNDGIFSYTDAPKNRWTSWNNPAMSGNQWVGILFGQDKTAVKHKVAKLGVAFFEDWGCPLPLSYKVQYFTPDVVPMWPKKDMASLAGKNNPLAKDENWKDVENLVGNTTKDTIVSKEVNEVTFDAVETYAVRIVMTPQPNLSLALTELQAYGYSLGGAVVPQDPEENFNLNVFPSLRQYKAKDGKFEAAPGMKLVVVASEKANQDARLREVAGLVSQEFGAYGIPENKALPVVYGEKSDAADGDIVLELKDQVKDVPKAEGFAVQVGKKVEIQALTANGAMYALRSVMQYLQLKKAMPYGDIIDYPEIDERALHLDMGRKYFTPEWIKNLIKEVSFSRLNTLQLHFSEHEGYRLESEIYPDIMSDQYITKEEMREIIATAKKYGVEIIPSFDNPGHLRTALRHHQDLCLVDKWGQKDTGALDINKEEARQFIKNIIKEYAELFVDSRYFHIGGDEFINFNNFGNYPSLTEFGQKHVPQGVTANGQDGYMAYINEIAKYTYDLGFVPRIWNDGVYRLNMNPHIDLHDYIQVCYWTRWDRNMASVDQFIQKGHELINVNDMMYYVLKIGGGAYSTKPDPRKIYNGWHGGVFSGNNNGQPQTYELPHEKIKGACYAIWCDHPAAETEEQVSKGIFYSLRAMAEKSWAGRQEKGEYDDFKAVLEALGKALGVEKPLPGAGAIDLKDLIEVRLVCQSGSGQILGLPEARLGRQGEHYQFTAPSFKGFKLEDGAPSLSGTFNMNDTITLTYKRFVSLKPLEEALENVFAEDAYIGETYQEYKEAVEKARALLTASGVTDIQIIKAISDMTGAAGKLVKKEWQPLYDRLKTPKPKDQYTKKTYEPYIKLVENLRMWIQGANTDISKLQDYMNQLDEAEANLKELGSEVEISVEVKGAGEYSSYTFDKMLDGNRETFAWTNQNQAVGHTFTFTFSSPVELSKVTLVYPGGVGQDYIGGAVLEIKGDGDWEEAAKISGSQQVNPMPIDKKKAKEVRIRITEEKPNWTKIAEMEFDYVKWNPQPQQPDKSKLEKAIADAKAAKETDKYKHADADKKEAFDKALTKAEEVMADANADEAAIKAAADALKAATEALNGTAPQPKPDKTKLKEAIAAAKAVMGTDKYKNATADKKREFEEALSDAEETAADEDAEEADIQAATEALTKATADLDGTTPQPQHPDKSELEKAIADAKAAKETDKYKYADADKKEAFDKALTKAEEVMADAGAEEAAIKAAADALKAAAEALNGTTPPAPNPNPNPNPNPDPNPQPNPEPEYELPLTPYVPEPAPEPTPAPAPAQPEVAIEEEQVALSSAETALVKELTKDMSKEEDKKLVEKLVAKQIKYPEFVQKLSDTAMTELAANVGSSFKDETSSSWYAKELSVMRLLNLITGYEDGTFRSTNPVTAQEYLTILVRAGQWELEKSEDTNWFAPYQKTAQKLGLLNGVSVDLAKKATREEIAALSYNFIVSLLEKAPVSEGEKKFADQEEIAAGYQKAVAYLTQKEVLKGYEDGSFGPDKPVVRGEVAAIIYRLLAVLGK